MFWKDFKIVWKVASVSVRFKACLESFQVKLKISQKKLPNISGYLGTFPSCIETFQMSGKFPVYLEFGLDSFRIRLKIFSKYVIFWFVRKLSRMSEKFQFYLESFQFIWKVYILSGKVLGIVKDFQQIRKVSGWLENSLDFLKNFKDCLEVYSLSGKFSDYLEV